MKKSLNILIFGVWLLIAIPISCNSGTSATNDSQNQANVDSVSTTVESSTKESTSEPDVSIDLKHKYFIVNKTAGTSALLDLYNDSSFTNVLIGPNGFRTSGSGNWKCIGSTIRFTRTHGISIDGETKFMIRDDGKIWIVLPNGNTYVQDDEGYYLRNSISTPSLKSNIEEDTDFTKEDENINISDNDLVFDGTISDILTGIKNEYRLILKSDFSAASIGGGPFISLQDQGDGSYMWISGSIIGMSIKPGKDICFIYGIEGDHIGSFYRK